MNRACPSTSRLGRACCGLADTVDPTAQMKHERNTELRVHSAVMETSLEIVFTWTGVVLVLMYSVSADGRAVNTATVISNGVVQHAIEMLVDLVVILHLTVLQVSEHAHQVSQLGDASTGVSKYASRTCTCAGTCACMTHSHGTYGT